MGGTLMRAVEGVVDWMKDEKRKDALNE